MTDKEKERRKSYFVGYNKAKKKYTMGRRNDKPITTMTLLEQIHNLEKENAELKRDKEDLIFIRNQNAKCMCEDKENLTKAKELLKKVIRFTWGEGWNYSLSVKVEAEKFLKEMEK